MDTIANEYAKQMQSMPLLSAEEEKQLSQLIQQGDSDAKQRMIESNYGLVLKIAHDVYAKQARSLDYQDLVQEGMIGLMTAVDKFDWTRKTRFSTCAYQWIRQAIYRFVHNHEGVIRRPVHQHEQASKIKKASESIMKSEGRRVTQSELFAITGIKPRSLQATLETMSKTTVYIYQPISQHSRESDPIAFADVIADETQRIDDLVITKDCNDRLRALLRYIPRRERIIIILYYGLDNGVKRTRAEVGRMLGISRERVRQLHDIALARLQALPEVESCR